MTSAVDRLRAALALKGSLSTEETIDVVLDVATALETPQARPLLESMLATLRAPTLAAAQLPSAHTDVGMLAAIAYTLLAGVAPFADGESAEDDVPLLAGVPDALAEVIEQALARQPARRPLSVAEFRFALATFATKTRAPSLDAFDLRSDSDPTLTVDNFDYAELVREQREREHRVAETVATSGPESTIVLESADLIEDVAPSVRSLIPAAPLPEPLLPTIAPPRAPSASRTTKTALAIAAVSACMAAVGLVRMTQPPARAKAAATAATSAAATADTVSTTTLPASAPAPKEPVTTASAVPPAPRAVTVPAAPGSAAPAKANAKATARPNEPASSAPASATITQAPAASATPAAPAAPPAPAASAATSSDDLRQFLDARE